MRRLYLQIYAAFLLIVVLFAALMAMLWWLGPERPVERGAMEGLAALVGAALPGPQRPAGEQQAALEKLAARRPVDVSLFSADGRPLAQVGAPLPPPAPGAQAGWTHGWRQGPAVVIRLEDGRSLVARPHRRPPAMGVVAGLAALALAVAVGAWPLARRLSRRIERLQAQVDALGAGDLKARVDVEGNDEVAELARRFNRAAERIEQLVVAQKSMLANVSHELRSPLARMGMAVELLAAGERPELKARLQRDIGELDALIGELLLSSRMDAGLPAANPESLDLLALAAEEAAAFGVQAQGDAVDLQGDARLLRRLLRNLLENARRYGDGSPVEVEVMRRPEGGACIAVSDRGPGVPEDGRERIFEPFHRLPGAPETGSGVGLGLALVRQIARLHGGDVRCVGREGGGTRMEVTLAGLDRADG